MNIEEDFAVAAACSCIATTVRSARRRRRHRRTQGFLSVLAITIQKQTEILREKPSRGVACDSTCDSNRRKITSSFEQVRNSCDIAAISRRYRSKSRRNRGVVYTCDFEVATSARQKLH